jgi:methyl-accepting chemotaxis protein
MMDEPKKANLRLLAMQKKLGQAEKSISALTVSGQKIESQLNTKANALNQRITTILWVLTGVLIVLGMSLSLLISHVVTKPLVDAIRIAKKVVANDLSSTITVNSKDETGELLQSLFDMQRNLLSRQKTDAAVVDEMNRLSVKVFVAI